FIGVFRIYGSPGAFHREEEDPNRTSATRFWVNRSLWTASAQFLLSRPPPVQLSTRLLAG
ncbi:hypothetical protein BgiMline_009427, partial [Biomphalaria glabrata]